MRDLSIVEWETGRKTLRGEVAEVLGQPGLAERHTRLVALVLSQVQRHQLDLFAPQRVVQHLSLLVQLVYRFTIQITDHLDLEHGDVVLLDLLTLADQLGDLVAQTGHISGLTFLRLHIQLGLILRDLIGQLIDGLALIHRVDVNGHIQVTIIVVELIGPANHDVLRETR